MRGHQTSARVVAKLRVTALRMRINVARRDEKESLEAEAFFEAFAASEDNPEALFLKKVHLPDFKEALVNSIGRLTNRERSLLRYAFSDGLTVARIGAVYGVSAATASRWIQTARDRLRIGVRDDLVARLRLSEDEVESIVKRALSLIETTIARYLTRKEG